MLTRVLGVPAAAVVVLVAAPGLVVRTLSPAPAGTTTVEVAAAKPAPAPPAATLKIGVAGERGAEGPLYLDVKAKGGPPRNPSYLVDESGVHRATVTAAAPQRCAHVPVHDTLTGDKTWCLAVTSLDSGHELSGLVGGDPTQLTLTLTRRTTFFSVPFWVLLAGLLLPLPIGWFLKWLQRRAGRTVVDRIVERNYLGTRRKQIADIRTWRDRQVAAGTKPGDLAALLRTMVNQPPVIRRERKLLKAALAKSTLQKTHAYYVAAQQEARKRRVEAADIVDGTTVKPPAAKAFRLNLHQLELDQDALEKLEHALEAHADSPDYGAADRALRAARGAFDAAASPADLPGLVDPFVQAAAAVGATGDTGGHERVMLDYMTRSGATRDQALHIHRAIASRDVDQASRLLREVHAVHVEPEPTPEQRVWRDELEGIALTAAAAVVPLAFAGLTVTQAAYVSKPDFASVWDYLALFSAALASGAAATVLTLFDYWRPQPSDA